jgi:hypothetical protein
MKKQEIKKMIMALVFIVQIFIWLLFIAGPIVWMDNTCLRRCNIAPKTAIDDRRNVKD